MPVRLGKRLGQDPTGFESPAGTRKSTPLLLFLIILDQALNREVHLIRNLYQTWIHIISELLKRCLLDHLMEIIK